MSARALIAAAFLAVAAPAVAQEAPPVTEPAPAAQAPALPEASERCGVIVRENGQLRTQIVEGFSVANATPPMRLPEGFTSALAIACGRSEMLFTRNDFRVITDLNVPFYITVGERLLVIEMVGGQFTARAARGALTADEISVLQRALNDAQDLVPREQRP